MKLCLDGLTLTINDGVTALVASDERGRRRLRRALVQSVHGRWDRLLLDERTSRVDAVEGPPLVMICAHRMRGVSRLADRVVMLEAAGVRFEGSLADFCTRPDGSSDEPEDAFLRRLFAAGA
ncbi:hypothetical protein [Nocardioides marmorisolisilvae]|uniref:Uncharacterized protein n=1 Tax=Nocardioides marmorisolisilvae TaxID=1542737 RepID=A0A3N0DQ01_9ACTN|nr:hypothetical protein [Nocardioides marmorisolisilvae]RNL77705.1 hypothetical protein EFL95_17020 [Nocardioides marmorisolisilvae]